MSLHITVLFQFQPPCAIATSKSRHNAFRFCVYSFLTLHLSISSFVLSDTASAENTERVAWNLTKMVCKDLAVFIKDGEAKRWQEQLFAISQGIKYRRLRSFFQESCVRFGRKAWAERASALLEAAAEVAWSGELLKDAASEHFARLSAWISISSSSSKNQGHNGTSISSYGVFDVTFCQCFLRRGVSCWRHCWWLCWLFAAERGLETLPKEICQIIATSVIWLWWNMVVVEECLYTDLLWSWYLPAFLRCSPRAWAGLAPSSLNIISRRLLIEVK